MNRSEYPKLLTAALHGSLRDVDKLLNDGEDLKVTDSDGNTPLHCAAMRGHWSVVKRLLEVGADATVRNNLGLMPKALAQKMMITDAIDPDRYKDVIELFDNQPVYVKEAKPKVSTNAQAAPSEKDSGRVDICNYFKGHVLHWSGNLSKEDDYSVYEIIYGGGLAKSMEKLREAIKTVEGEKIKSEEAAKKKEESMKKQETEEEAKLRKKNELKQREKSKMADEAKKNQKSDQRTEQSAKPPNEGPKEADIQKEAKRWIHLPANNLFWVKHLVEKLCADEKITEADCNEIKAFIIDSFFEHGRKNSGSCFRQPLLYTHPLKPHLMSFVIPFIDADSEFLFNKKNKKDLISATRNPPQASKQTNQSEKKAAEALVKLKELEELEERSNYLEKLTKEYKEQLHVARTLGQSYYDDSADKQTRGKDKGDDKQLVTRYMERIQRESEGNDSKDGKDLKEVKVSKKGKDPKKGKDSKEGEKEGYTELPILVVKQLWLWTIDKRTIITASPVRYNKLNPATLQKYIIKELERGRPDFSLEDFVKHIVVRTVDFIEDPFKAGLEQQCFDMYSSEIASLSSKVSECYKDFQDSLEPENRSRVQANQTGIKTEYGLLRDIRSVIDEINILQPVFDEQHSMTRRLLKWVDIKTGNSKKENAPNNGEQNGPTSSDKGGNGLQKWEDFAVSDQTDIIKQRVQWLEKDAKRVENSIDTILNLKQKQASIDSADSAAFQGNVVLVFTIVTIIFTPLMFMVALFTIPQDGAHIPFEGRRSAGYMAAAEFATFVVLGIVFVVLLWKNRIFTESFWKPITSFFCCGRRSKTEVVEAVEIYPTEPHTKRLRRPAADVYRQVRRRRIEDTDVESVLSETSFVNFFQSNADKPLFNS